MSEDSVRSLVEWTSTRGIAYISDEVYANTIFDRTAEPVECRISCRHFGVVLFLTIHV